MVYLFIAALGGEGGGVGGVGVLSVFCPHKRSLDDARLILKSVIINLS